jgi:hypothetical protein
MEEMKFDITIDGDVGGTKLDLFLSGGSGSLVVKSSQEIKVSARIVIAIIFFE